MQFEHKLKDSRVKGSSDRSKGSRAEIAVGIAQGRRVGDVEGFGAELQPRAFRQREGLAHHHISRLIAGSSNQVAGTFADGELGAGFGVFGL